MADLSETVTGLQEENRRLLARIAELEGALRWRVTGEELPPEGLPVIAERATDLVWPCDIVMRLGSNAWANSDGFTHRPVRWMPIPGVADGS